MSAPATTCPSCNKPLPASVVSGPAQAVVRCEGCQTLLLWSNGRVMRSAKSATGTVMGMPAVKLPAAKESEAPLPELKPEGDAVPVSAKSSFPKPPPPKTQPPRTATQPVAARVTQKAPSVTGIGDNVPTKVAAATTPPPGAKPAAPPAASKPAVPATKPAPPTKPAAPLTKPAAAAPKAAPAKSDSGKTEAPHVVVAAVAPLSQASAGDLIDPSAWFAGGEVSDVVPPEKLPPIESEKPPRADSTGAAPLPPPPAPALSSLEAEPFEIEPFGEEKTPAVPLSVMDIPSGPIATSARDPSMQIAVGPPSKPVTREPSQKVATTPAAAAAREPSQKVATPPAAATEPPGKKSAATIRGADPLVPSPKSSDLPSASTAIGKPPEAPVSTRQTIMGRPAFEAPKPAEPVAAAVSMLPSPAGPATSLPTSPTLMAPAPVAPAAEPAHNAPRPIFAREPSAEALPPPPASPAPLPAALEATAQTEMPPVVTSRVPRAVPRRLLFIVGGAAVGVIVLVFMVVALSHGSKPPLAPIAKVPPPTTPPPVAEVAKPEPVAPPTTAPAPPAPKPEAPAPTPTPTPTTAPTTTPEPTEAATPPAPRKRRTLGGKKVVLEYDPKPTSPAPPPAQVPTPMGEDPATVARARETYHRGNVKLFAGDTAGAIGLYREALKVYPGYVAGYRGLGLAFESAGQSEEALKAFHTYVRTVPSAADTPIIRRRIERLESQKPGSAQ